MDTAKRNNLQIELWVLSGLVHKRQDILALVSEDVVNNSTIYQMIIERGIEQGIQQGREQGIQQGREQGIQQGREQGIQQGKELGAKEFVIDQILSIINDRFNVDATTTLTSALETIDDLEDYSGLLREALDVEHLEDFLRSLESRNNGKQ